MHLLVEVHGQPGWVAVLTPLSVDGMIVAASMTLLAQSRSGACGGPLALLVVGSVASLAANVAVAEPTTTGRVIAARLSFAPIASYELLMRQVRRAAVVGTSRRRSVEVVGRPAGASSAGRPSILRPAARGTAWWPQRGRSGAGVAVGAGESIRRRLAAVGQGYRRPAWPARAVGSARQAVRTGWRAGAAGLIAAVRSRI